MRLQCIAGLAILSFLWSVNAFKTSSSDKSQALKKNQLFDTAKERWNNQLGQPLHIECDVKNGEGIFQVRSEFHMKERDRQYRWQCQTVATEPMTDCTWSNEVNDYQGSMLFMCQSNFVMTGISSIYDRKQQDRKWKIKCCRANNHFTRACRISDSINRFQKPSFYTAKDECSDPGVMTGLASEISKERGPKDREWKVLQCSYANQKSYKYKCNSIRTTKRKNRRRHKKRTRKHRINEEESQPEPIVKHSQHMGMIATHRNKRRGHHHHGHSTLPLQKKHHYHHKRHFDEEEDGRYGDHSKDKKSHHHNYEERNHRGSHDHFHRHHHTVTDTVEAEPADDPSPPQDDRNKVPNVNPNLPLPRTVFSTPPIDLHMQNPTYILPLSSANNPWQTRSGITETSPDQGAPLLIHPQPGISPPMQDISVQPHIINPALDPGRRNPFQELQYLSQLGPPYQWLAQDGEHISGYNTPSRSNYAPIQTPFQVLKGLTLHPWYSSTILNPNLRRDIQPSIRGPYRLSISPQNTDNTLLDTIYGGSRSPYKIRHRNDEPLLLSNVHSPYYLHNHVPNSEPDYQDLARDTYHYIPLTMDGHKDNFNQLNKLIDKPNHEKPTTIHIYLPGSEKERPQFDNPKQREEHKIYNQLETKVHHQLPLKLKKEKTDPNQNRIARKLNQLLSKLPNTANNDQQRRDHTEDTSSADLHPKEPNKDVNYEAKYKQLVGEIRALDTLESLANSNT